MHVRKAVGAFFLLFPALASAQVGLNVDVEAAVRAKFGDTPIMIDIARCESKFAQFNTNGSVLHGGLGGTMIGVFQISESVHADFAKNRGMDIYTLDGNLAYALYLYNKEGTQPWISSFPCWGKDNDAQSNPTVRLSDPDSLTVGNALVKNLSLGMVDPQVHLLQEVLNAKGYPVAGDGPGSPGEETQKFGSLTRDAVRKFQCATMSICDGDEYTSGYGFVGAKIRAALLSAATVAPHVVATSSTAAMSEYTPEQQAQIAALQAQIAELTKILTALIAGRGS